MSEFCNNIQEFVANKVIEYALKTDKRVKELETYVSHLESGIEIKFNCRICVTCQEFVLIDYSEQCSECHECFCSDNDCIPLKCVVKGCNRIVCEKCNEELDLIKDCVYCNSNDGICADCLYFGRRCCDKMQINVKY